MRNTRFVFKVMGVLAVSCACAQFARAADLGLTVGAILEKHARATELAPALAEVVKLHKAGVSDSLTLAYIQNSIAICSPDAQDILRLRQQEVSSQVIIALIQRSEELRCVPTAGNPSSVSSATVEAAVPAVLAPSSPAQHQSGSSVSVTCIGYPRCDYHPGYHGFGSYCSPFVYPLAPRFCSYGGYGPGLVYGWGFVGASYGGYGTCR